MWMTDWDSLLTDQVGMPSRRKVFQQNNSDTMQAVAGVSSMSAPQSENPFLLHTIHSLYQAKATNY